MRWIVCFCVLLMSVTIAAGSENQKKVTGRLISAQGDFVVIALDNKENIITGTPIIFFEEIPGVGEVSVKGSWVVISQNGVEIKGKAEPGSSIPQIGCTARLKALLESKPPSVKKDIVPEKTKIVHVPPVQSIHKPAKQILLLEKDPLVLKYTSKPWLGVMLGKRININGVHVLSVMPNSTALEYGIRRGDIITRFGRNDINTMQQLISSIAQSFPGRNYSLRLVRNKERLLLNIKLKTFPLAQSMHMAGLDYQAGNGVTQNESKAIALFRKAAEAGYGQAHYSLGIMYQKGEKGLPRDDQKCIKHLEKAAQNNSLHAMMRLGNLYKYGEIVQQDSNIANNYYLKASDNGLIQATEMMGYQYYNGNGVPVNKAKAADYWRWAANFGFSSSQVSLGYMYYIGEGGLARNWNTAEYWFQQSANKGNDKGKEWLARIRQEKIKLQQQQIAQKKKKQQQTQKSFEMLMQTLKQFQNKN